MSNDALLALADGSVFHGRSIGADGEAVGEVVFNTAMSGYQEILTDPSYARQLVTLTASHIGNVGTNDEDNESRGVFCEGLIVRSSCDTPSNWRATKSLPAFLREHGKVAISDIDTRMLTRLLRDKGAQSGCLVAGTHIDADRAVSQARAFTGLAGMDLAREVTIDAAYDWQEGSINLYPRSNHPPVPKCSIVAYDFGIKYNILRLLVDSGCDVTVVPAETPAREVLAKRPDGVFLSNGPGDPEPCAYAIQAITELVDTAIPVFGICLGHQLLALASGARTTKMKFGHHGANHPVQELATGRVFITSQNHGFAVAETALPDYLEVTHRSLFDGSIQGVRRVDRPAFGFQGHPEASPGPHDIRELFAQFVHMMATGKRVSEAR